MSVSSCPVSMQDSPCFQTQYSLQGCFLPLFTCSLVNVLTSYCVSVIEMKLYHKYQPSQSTIQKSKMITCLWMYRIGW